MPIPTGYSRNTIYGHLSGGEVFNMSLWVSEAPLDQAAAQTQAQALATALSNNITTPATGASAPNAVMLSDSGYDGVRVYSYTQAGGKASFIGDASVNKVGTATSNILPNQLALAITLQTSVAGRRAKGRIYMPYLSSPLQVGGNIQVATAGGWAKFWAQLIHDWNAAVAPGKVGVLSQTYGTFQPITSVKVDTRLDVQRRRANRQTNLGSYTQGIV